MLARFRTIAFGSLIGALLAATPAAAQVDDEPLPRFEDRICPGIVGLKREAAETMVGLIRANVEELGLLTAGEELCEPNVVVAFVEDGQAFLSQLADDNGNLFAEMSRQDRERLLAETGPSRTLLKVRARTRDGMPIPRRENLTNAPQTLMAMAHSKIYTATRNDILAALVLFDRDSIRGLSLRQLADYATFRALSRILPPSPEARAASIVGLFEGGDSRPAALTEFDRTFLATLYAGVPNLPGSARLAALEDATGHEFPAHE